MLDISIPVATHLDSEMSDVSQFQFSRGERSIAARYVEQYAQKASYHVHISTAKHRHISPMCCRIESYRQCESTHSHHHPYSTSFDNIIESTHETRQHLFTHLSCKAMML